MKEDRYMQEHYHWAKVQNLWDHYIKKQKEILSTEDYELRVAEGYYPKEMPEWWRRRYRQRLSNLKNSFLKDSPDQSHFIFGINVGKRRNRHITTLKLNLQSIFIRSRNSSLNFNCMSYPSLSDIDFKNKMAWVWTTLKFFLKVLFCFQSQKATKICGNMEFGPNIQLLQNVNSYRNIKKRKLIWPGVKSGRPKCLIMSWENHNQANIYLVH